MKIPAEHLQMITVKISKSKMGKDRPAEDQTFARPFLWDRRMTLKDVHLKLFNYQKFLFEENHQQGESFKRMSASELYDKIFQTPINKPYRILVNFK
jgi:hypothetical protein